MSALRAKAKEVKGWYDREAKGWMLRSAEDAKAFAEGVMGKSEDEVADEAPLSIKGDIEPEVGTVDTMAMMAAIKAGFTVSPRDFTTNMPPTPKRKAIGLVSALLKSESQEDLQKVLKKNGYPRDMTWVNALMRGKELYKDGSMSINKLADIIAELLEDDNSPKAVKKGEAEGGKPAETKEQPKPGDRVALKDATTGSVFVRHHDGEGNVTGYTLADGRKVNASAPKAEQPKPKKRNKWISDEDAAEYGSLMDDLRRELGGGDIVEDEGAAYGNKPQVKPMNAEVLRKGTVVTYMMMKGGLRKFSDYCEAMVDELGDAIRPHLRPLYGATQNMDEVIAAGWDEEMDDRETVKAFDVYNFDKQGAVDLIETAQHVVDEQASAQDVANIINQLKNKRNEQRRKEADKTSASTKTIVDEAEAVASEVENQLKDATDVETAEALAERIDKSIEKVNEQLALLGYYEADPVESDYNEAYGYMRNAERKATQDAHKLATQIASDLGLTIDTKDKVKKGKSHNFGSKLVQSNIAPAGGEVKIRIPLNEERNLYISISLDPVEGDMSELPNRQSDDLRVSGIMYRVEGKGVSAMNNFAAPETTYDDLLADIKRIVRHYLPEEKASGNAPVELQPGEDIVAMAKRVSEASKPKEQTVKPEQTMGGLFDDLFAEQEENSNFVEPTTKTNKNEKTDVRPGTSEAGGEGGHEPRQNEPLGESKRDEAEGTDGRGMAGRDRKHPVSDTERGSSVSSTREGKQRLEPSERKNTRNNHAERGMDYAPKGEKARIDANIAAIELSQKIIEEGRTATKREMEVLRRYSGWGGLGSAFNEKDGWRDNPINKRLRELLSEEEYNAAVMSRNSAYYTPAPYIDVMWDIARALGFKGGRVLEGSAGIGNIIGLMPIDMSERSDIHAVEIDKTTGDILTLLYPDAKVEVQGFEQTNVGNGTVDLTITNVPFVTGLHVMDESGDSDLSKKFRDIHDFCIAKNVRKLREGGIGIFITSSGTLDNSQKLRDWLVSEGRADVVGAFRMNNQTFGGTAATSDIIVVRKRVNGRPSANAIDVSTVSALRTASYNTGETKRGSNTVIVKELPMLINRYYIEHPECMGGEMRFGFEEGDLLSTDKCKISDFTEDARSNC